MRKTDAIVIGGGQAGLAMSRSLSRLAIDHVVLERGAVGERWRTERWDSLHLLSTNGRSALPGLPHEGDPDAFMHASEFGGYLQRYARHICAPVLTGTVVESVTRSGEGYCVVTSGGEWQGRAVVIATGACDVPFRPAEGDHLSRRIHQVDSPQYRSPAQLPGGGVLVVGAAATGVQLAEEIHLSGRPVTLAVGNHTAMPRRYRGKDIYEWMHLCGILDDPALENGNLDAARRQPSLQLIGTPQNRDINLEGLDRLGVTLVGRLCGTGESTVAFDGSLSSFAMQSHRRMVKVLDRIDASIAQKDWHAPAADPQARAAFMPDRPAMELDLDAIGINSVVWATGFKRRYPWLHVPALDANGELRHCGGVVTHEPGLYAIGLNFLRRRRSQFIDGCGQDAEDLAPIILQHLESCRRHAA
jgi:putative flavoprotein involved in K+ transport